MIKSKENDFIVYLKPKPFNRTNFLLMKYWKHIVLFFIFLAIKTSQADAQGYLKLGVFQPTGELGFMFGKTLSTEIGFKDDLYQRHVRLRFGAAFIKQQPRMNPFPVNSYGNSSQGFFIYTATQQINKYNFIQFSIGGDYALAAEGKLKPYVGLDVSLTAIQYEYTAKSPASNSEVYNSTAGMSLRGRMGIEYELNNRTNIFFEAQRQYGLIVEVMYYSANDFGIGLTYDFN